MASYSSSSRIDLKVEKDFGIHLTDSQLRLQKRIHVTSTNITANAPAPGATGRTAEHAGPEMHELNLEISPKQDENNALLLRNALNKSNSSTQKRYSTGAVISTADQKAMLRKILAQKGRSRAAAVAQKSREQESTSLTQSVPVVEQQQDVPVRQQQEATSKPPIRHPTVQKQGRHPAMKSAPQPVITTGLSHSNPPTGDTSGSIKTSKEEQKALLRKVLENSRAKRLNAAEQRISPRASLIESQKQSMSNVETKREPLSNMRRPDTSGGQAAKLSPKSILMQSRRKSMIEIRKEPSKEPLRATSARLPLNVTQSPRGAGSLEVEGSKENATTTIHTVPLRSQTQTEKSAREMIRKKLSQAQVRNEKSPLGGRGLSAATKRPENVAGLKAVQTLAPSGFTRTKLDVLARNEATRPKAINQSSSQHKVSPSRLRLPPAEQELDSYSAFISVLKEEGANDHRELFRSFRSIFYSGKIELTEKQKRIKFDSKAKKTLTEMNLYLKRASDMECKTESQLVNDKKYAREEDHKEPLSPGNLVIAPTQSHESSSDASSAQPLSEIKKVKAWMTSFRTKQAKPDEVAAQIATRFERPVSDAQSNPDEPVDRQASWLAAHRKNQLQKAVQKHCDAEESIALPGSGRQRHIDEPAQKFEAPKSYPHSYPPEPVDRQTSWLAAHRKVQLQKTLQIHTDTEEAIASPVSVRKRRIDQAESHLPPWAKVHLKSTKEVSNRDNDESGERNVIPWSKSQLRETRALIDIDEISDQNNIPVETTRKSPVSFDIEVRPDHSQPRSEDQRDNAQPSFQYQPKSRKDPVTHSFVPTTGVVSPVAWSKLKLKHVGESQSEITNSVPWADVKLRKVAEKEPVISDDSATEELDCFQTPQKKSSQLNQEPLCLLEDKIRIEDIGVSDALLCNASATPLKTTIQSRLSDLLESRLGKSPELLSEEEITAAESSVSESSNEEASPILVKKVYVAMQGPDNKHTTAPDIKDALSTIFVSPTTKQCRVSKAEQSIRNDSCLKEIQNTAPVPDIKSALANMFASRAGHPLHSDKTSVISAGDLIDLNELSPAHAKLLDGLISVELSTPTGVSDEVVILGSELIFVGAPQSLGSSKQRVIWHQNRENIESITLDMARNVANLILSNASDKSLSFKSAEGCLRFAASFYQTADVVAMEPISHSRNDAALLSDASGLEGSAEQLNKEEQKLLQRFREARKVRDADDLLKAMIGGDESDDALSEEDQKIVERYKRMLRMQIPPEAVRHKMTRDGVDQRLLNIVLQQDVSSTSSSHVSKKNLSVDEEEIAQRHRRMLKMRIPKDAVLHKMTKECVDQKIIDAVLSFDVPEQPLQADVEAEQPKSDFSDEEEKLITSYRKMLKMCIPPEAIRHKMKKDQVDEKVVFAIFPDDAKAAKKALNEPQLTTDEQKIVETYLKMLKMMIPRDAVRHRMVKDGVDAKILAVVLGEDLKENNAASGLTEAEEKAVVTYKKMLKMHFPEDAVRHKMAKEGASENVIGMVFEEKKVSVPPIPTSTKIPLRGSKLVALHWTPLSGEELDNSVWRASKKQKVVGAQPETNDISKLIELFKKKSNPKDGIAAGPVSNSDRNGRAKLIDLNRANNIAISLKAFKEFSHQQLAQTIAQLDPQELISGERVLFVKDLLPNAQERQAIKTYNGDDSRLVPAEIFFRQIVLVKRVENKVEVMKTMVTFKANALGFLENYKILERACLQVQSSEKLQELLEMVLYIGNIMNEGTRTGGAAGFKFESLLKLTQTKSFDGKTTVLDYLVMIFVAKNKRATIDIKADFNDCQTASKMLISDMNAEVKAMSDALQTCKTELTTLKRENGRCPNPKVGAPDPAPLDPMSALLGAIKARASHEDGSGSHPTPSKLKAATTYLDAINTRKDTEKGIEGDVRNPGKLNLDAINDKCQLKGENEEGSLLKQIISSCTNPDLVQDEGIKVDRGKSDLVVQPLKPTRPSTIDGGINRLDEFISEAEQILEKLQSSKNAALSACRTLAKYCGESGGEQVATTLLGILYEFATNLSDALKKYDMRLELEAKKAAQKQKHDQQSRRKTFVESKGFGQIVASKDALHSRDDPAVMNDQKCSESSGVEGTPGDDKRFKMDFSQVQSDSKAKSMQKSGDRTSLVAMVNKMLKEATPQVRQDFQAGVVYDDIEDETLKAIYEKERASLRTPPRRRLIAGESDLMSAIQQRRNAAKAD